ncbi:hypothetical protein P171DRAFT_231344 [Karstenula rhodostoma CBS 690.94]|uniref:Uncharacterized protein n=1 Tax=Karstenula rhodostoma CBS 690.94 TaxID=1392251 RepID=A0A9P4UES1_9PLEO|nr:hypothetical protein P171DRAFT_231344 [Karstenula rhodostoma CBS 690.94]
MTSSLYLPPRTLCLVTLSVASYCRFPTITHERGGKVNRGVGTAKGRPASCLLASNTSTGFSRQTRWSSKQIPCKRAERVRHHACSPNAVVANHEKIAARQCTLIVAPRPRRCPQSPTLARSAQHPIARC